MKVFLVPGGEKWAMKLFFVGVNLGSQQEYMRIYLAGVNPYKEETMRLFLAQASRDKRLNNEVGRIPCCVLESFFYIDKYTERLIPLCKDFMLDSGAFTFMEGGGGKIDWNDYVCRYADFVKRNNISKYLELDIDSVVGLPRVLELRRLLEKQVGRPCIPVWHRSRGMDNFRKMCDEYNYVAVGGIVSGEIKGDDYRVFPYLIQEAHKRNARIHGLGFTNSIMLIRQHGCRGTDSERTTFSTDMVFLLSGNQKTRDLQTRRRPVCTTFLNGLNSRTMQKHTTRMKNTLLILSGGLDSVTMLHEFRDSIALAVTFDYGSNHASREIEMAKKNCQKLGIRHIVIPLEFMRKHFSSSLLEGAEAIPEGDYRDETMRSTVVPFRNGIMLAICAGLAESRELGRIMLANHSGDHAIYPDCRPGFIGAMRDAIIAGTYNSIRLVAPYTEISKADIVRRGVANGVDFKLTYSCYKGGAKHCGRCGTCVERKEAFSLAGINDPTEYEE